MITYDLAPCLRSFSGIAPMPRRARVRLAGIPLHVVQRGNNRSPCFFAGDDYSYYLDHACLFAGRFECALHAFALMTNHVHLLITPYADIGVSLMMKNLSQRYAQHINKVHGRSGSLWEGRYRSCFVLDETYVLTCYRYIELNPVRAGMVRHPRDYPWTSFHSNAIGTVAPGVTPHDAYLRLGNSGRERREAYCDLLGSSVDNASLQRIRDATIGNTSLGSEHSQAVVEQRIGRRITPGTPGRPRKERAGSIACAE